MKVAWCIHGQPRLYLQGFQKVKEFIEKNPEVEFDFFIHGWFSESEAGGYYSFSDHRYINKDDLLILPNADKEIIDLYKPKSVLFEKSQDFDTQFLYGSLLDQSSPYDQKHKRFNNILSSINSKAKANAILQEYMLKNKEVQYDLVMNTRFDYTNDYVVDLKSVRPDRLSIILNRVYNTQSHEFILNDSYVIGGLNIIDNYNQCFYNIRNFMNDEIFKERCLKNHHYYYCINPETLMLLNMMYCFPDVENPLDMIDIRDDMLHFIPY